MAGDRSAGAGQGVLGEGVTVSAGFLKANFSGWTVGEGHWRVAERRQHATAWGCVLGALWGGEGWEKARSLDLP